MAIGDHLDYEVLIVFNNFSVYRVKAADSQCLTITQKELL